MSAKLKKTAQELASKGRYGDTMLLHVNPIEVAGIASLVPGGRLPINPHTGLPEAFWFLGPLLAGLFGAAAPAAAATGLAASAAPAALAQGAATAAGTAGALGAGAGAAAPGFLGTLGSIGSGLMKGIGSLFGAGGAGAAGAGGAAAAGLPVGMEAGLSTALPVGVDAMTTGAIPAAATAGGNTGIAALQAAGASPASILPQSTAIPAMGAEIGTALPLGPVAPISATPANVLANPAGQSFAGTGVATGGPASPAPWAGLRDVTSGANASTAGYFPPAPGAPGKGLFGGISDLVGKLPGGIMPWAIGAQMLGGLFKGGGGGGGSKEEEGDDVEGGDYDYAGGEADFPDEGYEPGIDAEHNYYPQQKKMRMYANGGLVRGYAQGGPVDLQAQMPQDMTFPQNGIGSLMSPEQIPQSPFPVSQIGAPPEPAPEDDIPVATDNDKELIAQTVEAIRGTIPNPEQIMLAFVKEFGEQALQDLIMRVQGMGAMENNGQSDSIPAMIDGQQPAALSEGEYVVPADAVSGMGNGSTAAGAQQLDSLVGNVRQARTGSQAQPPMLNAGGLVSLYGR